MQEVDYIVIGGGLFGVYAALYLANQKFKVCLIEKEKSLLSKASLINQARLHSGYHYPRSIATAQMAFEYKDRFIQDHKAFIHTQFENYYAINKTNSFTNSQQFEQFCHFIDIPLEKVEKHALFNFDQLEALYLTQEYSFDLIPMAEYYKNKLKAHQNITTLLFSKVDSAVIFDDHWKVDITSQVDSKTRSLVARAIINATYAGTNSIHALFGIPAMELVYEISEIALVECKEILKTGLTVMDGPFASYMPYGFTGLTALSSVPYTHHKVSYDVLPTFDCQTLNKSCTPDFIAPCTLCDARPASNEKKMILQMSTYLNKQISMQHIRSLYTIKTKLKSSYIDDSRLTKISKMQDSPAFYCLFSGKLNSIYEIEKLLPHTF